MNPAKKNLLWMLAGGVLLVVCGTLVVIGLLLSWYPPWHDATTLLKFVFHPTTLLFFAGAGLFFWGLFKTARDSSGRNGGNAA